MAGLNIAVITKCTFHSAKYQAVKMIVLVLLMYVCKMSFTFDQYNKLKKTVCSKHTGT